MVSVRSISRRLYWAGYRYVRREADSFGMAEAILRSVERSHAPSEFVNGAMRAFREMAPVPGVIS